VVINKRLVVVLVGFMLLASGCWHDVGSFGEAGQPDRASRVLDINDRDDLVGWALVPGTYNLVHAFIWNPEAGGEMIDLTPLERRETRARAVNRLGIVTGTIDESGPPARRAPSFAFVWWAFTGLDVLPLPAGAYGAQALDINDQGTVLVVGVNETGAWQGSYLWDPGGRTYTSIPSATPGMATRPEALDEHGGVVGSASFPSGDPRDGSAVLWEPGTLTLRALPHAPGTNYTAFDRNGHGMIVGRAHASAGLIAVYWPSADAAPIELAGRDARAVNDAGQIVGCRETNLRTPDWPFTAVMWEPARGRATDLGDKGHGSCAEAVNGSGRSAGFLGDRHEQYAGAWWDPPPP
jgi:uncharacterized membrane protein